MKRFSRQRWWGFLLLGLASITVLAAHMRWSAKLPKYAFISGWALLAMMTFLALYNGRKKIPFLPAGRSEAWLQLHIYGGYFTVLLFAVHVNFRVPDGWFESILTGLFAPLRHRDGERICWIIFEPRAAEATQHTRRRSDF
jgi:hypothetical protein